MIDSEPVSKTSVHLVRELGLFDSTMMIVGMIIGSGIFLTAGLMAQYLPSAGFILLAWCVAGLLALTGALPLAELGVAMPRAGGIYVYLREAYGHLSGFLFGWVMFIVYQTAAIAILSVAFAEYFGYFFPSLSTKTMLFSTGVDFLNHRFTLSLSMGQIVGVTVIVLLTAINYFGVVFGKIIQNIFTVVKIGTIAGFIILGLTIGKGNPIEFEFHFESTGLGLSRLISGFGLAVVAASWAYNGWNYITFVAEEIKKPERNIPLSLLYGVVGIMVLYVLTNYVYLLALPVDEMAGVVTIAEKASTALFGRATTAFVSGAVVIATFGAMNGTILTGARVFYAMAKDRLFFKKMAEVHPRYRTPGFALIVQAVWACLYAVTGTFEQLFTFAMVVTLMFWIAGTASVFTLRKKFPDLKRPYKTWGYPAVPLLFIIVSSGVLINTVLEKPVESIAGIGFTLIGIPIYYFWKKRQDIPSKNAAA